MCENLVCVANTIGQLQHSEYLKPMFLDTFKWAIRLVFSETVTFLCTCIIGIQFIMNTFQFHNGLNGRKTTDKWHI